MIRESLLTSDVAGFSPPPGFGGPSAPPGGPRKWNPNIVLLETLSNANV